ncbi:modular serine protease [Drosophila grimshawi]|uniref:GH19473 n=1 Tax=Drosophila grimshawi TaxID=7222 RepID=B4JGL2_DROGR|nr:modular serine protease [Drosophila grimshawi]EDV93709.1 GH19473 [Drosophila grimshawi]
MIFKYTASHLLRICLISLSFSAKSVYGACGATKFECDNGSCISQFEVCDGVKNCPDGTDETGITCVSQREHCSKPFFQCSYGACVIGTASCNGVKECADGSDETLLRCGTDDDIRDFERRLQGNCQINEIKCPSKICIDKTKYLCDGKDDCGDGYDESVTLCGHLDCPGYSFKCANGACISKTLACNGKNDCFDGTDEAPLLCNTTSRPEKDIPLPESRDQLGCPLPYIEERPILKDRSGTILQPPIVRATVYFSCHPGHFLEGPESSHCANRQWSLHIVPKCVKYCDALRDSSGHSADLFNGYSTRPTCVFNGQQVNCAERYHPPGTEVTFVCATGFQTLQTSLPSIKCLSSGYWSRDRVRCDQECGQIATPLKQFSAFGYSVNNTAVPWHVGIYVNHTELNYNFVCGGTLLTPDVVITAAHCVYSDVSSQVYSVNTFLVVAAKLYRNYNDRTNEDRMQEVQDIIVPPHYKGREDNYLNDLALIILKKPYDLSNVIRPICVAFSNYAEREKINNAVVGKFAGWNFEDKRELQFVLATSKANYECAATLKDISSDKFCMYPTGKALACQGDSGGGFTAERGTSSGNAVRHFLYGVISSAPNAGQCAHSLITLTNIQYFDVMIKDAMKQSVFRS